MFSEGDHQAARQLLASFEGVATVHRGPEDITARWMAELRREIAAYDAAKGCAALAR